MLSWLISYSKELERDTDTRERTWGGVIYIYYYGLYEYEVQEVKIQHYIGDGDRSISGTSHCSTEDSLESVDKTPRDIYYCYRDYW